MPPVPEKFRDWSIVVTLAGVIIGGIATASVAFYRLGQVEEKQHQQDVMTATDHDLLIRIDANVQAISDRVKRIEAKQ